MEEKRIIDDNTPIALLTVGEFKKLLEMNKPKEFVHGLQGIADLFGVSKVTAQKYKNTWLSSAVAQQGKVLLTDKAKALMLFDENNIDDNSEIWCKGKINNQTNK